MPLLLILNLILLKRAAFDLQEGKKKPPASERGGKRVKNRLEAEIAANGKTTSATVRTWDRGVRHPRISKAGERRKQPGVFQEWIDALEVRVVQDIQRGGMEFKRSAFAEFDPLGDGSIRRVGDRIRYDVSSSITKWCAEDFISLATIGDEANLILLNSDRSNGDRK